MPLLPAPITIPHLQKRLTAADEAERAIALWWCVPLILIEKLRLQVLVPVTVVTCPILAIENGVNAQSVALNVMAVLFIFDFDDGRMA